MGPPSRRHLAALTLAMFLAPALAQSPPPSLATERAVPFEVIVNGARTGSWLFLERGGVLYAPREAFDEWRVQIQPDAPSIQFKGQEYRPLSAVPGFKAKVDFANQSVELQFSPKAFATLRMERELVKRPPVSPVLPSVFFNYDMSFANASLRDARSTHDLGVLSEVGISTGLGVLTTSSAARNLTNDAALGVRRQWLRLETTYTRDFPEQNRTLRIGDTVTRGAMWGRDVYFGGIRYGTNFALTPGFVSQPLPALSGLSAAPSTVELYVNDVLRQVSNVPTGPFVIDNFPTLTGNGEARLVVRDLLGRETVVVQRFFTSTQLLAAGLDDWSVEAGSVRRDLGIESSHYGQGFASATWRHGRTNELTLEGRAEASRRGGLLGMGVVSLLPWQVLAKAALVASTDSDLGRGGHWLMGLEYETLRGGMSVQVTRSTPSFREVGQETIGGEFALSPIKYQIAGNVLYNTTQFGTLGLGFASIGRFDGSRVSTISGNYSVRIGEKNNLTFTASRAFGGGSGSSVGLIFLVPLDQGRSASATANSRSGKQDLYLAAVQNPGIETDLGWRVLAGQQQNQHHAEGGVYYQGRYGDLSADASTGPAQTAVRVGASGGVVWADRHLFFSRRVDDSFAIAEVPGYANVGIGLGSNVMTRTNANGVALIPRLIPYVANSVRIDPKELPINAEIESIEQIAVPAYRSGVKVAFPVRSGRGALLKIVFDDAEPAPAGAIVKIEGDKEDFYVARRGEAFVTGMMPDSKLRLEWNNKQCPLEVKLPPLNLDEIARVGPVKCAGVAR